MRHDQEQAEEALAKVKANVEALVAQVKSKGATPTATLPSAEQWNKDPIMALEIGVAALPVLHAQVTRLGLTPACSCPTVKAGSSVDQMIEAALREPAVPAPKAPPKPATATAAPKAALPEEPVKCRTYTELAIALRAGKKAVLDRAEKPMSYTARCLEAIRTKQVK